MKKLFFPILLAMIIATSATAQQNKKKTTSHTSQMKGAVHSGMSKSTHDLMDAMDKLWEDHVTWTRNVIFCLVDDLPGTDLAVERLLKNQTDIGNAIKPYYGETAGNQLAELLKPHITIAAEVVKAARAGTSEALADANKRWYANADEIALFLSNANPYLELKEMKAMMHDHLKLTTDEAMARIQKNYKVDVAAYDKVHVEILKMADMLSMAIVKQFPGKFGKTENTKKTGVELVD